MDYLKVMAMFLLKYLDVLLGTVTRHTAIVGLIFVIIVIASAVIIITIIKTINVSIAVPLVLNLVPKYY